jgi:DNA-binding beta-propeller fold protein YncE
MRTKLFSLQFGICAALALTGLFSPDAFGQTLKEVTTFDLPGPGGKRFDYLTIDEDDHYLLSAHLAAGQTYVIDLGTNKVVATITDTPGAEGVEYIPGLKKFYTSNAHDNTIGVVDLKQMKVVKNQYVALRQRNWNAAVRPRGAEGVPEFAGPKYIRRDRSCD